MPEKEGKIFIEIVCANCGSVMKNGWNFVPNDGEETKWARACPVCKMPITVKYTVN